jgi:hypothetical protein
MKTQTQAAEPIIKELEDRNKLIRNDKVYRKAMQDLGIRILD